MNNVQLERASARNIAGTSAQKVKQGNTPIKSTTREPNRNQSGLEKFSSKIVGNFYSKKPKLIDLTPVPVPVPVHRLKNELNAPSHLLDSLNSKVEKLIADNQDRKLFRAKHTSGDSCRSIDRFEPGTHVPLSVNSFEK